jgi:hypothetical protein
VNDRIDRCRIGGGQRLGHRVADERRIAAQPDADDIDLLITDG